MKIREKVQTRAFIKQVEWKAKQKVRVHSLPEKAGQKNGMVKELSIQEKEVDVEINQTRKCLCRALTSAAR